MDYSTLNDEYVIQKRILSGVIGLICLYFTILNFPWLISSVTLWKEKKDILQSIDEQNTTSHRDTSWKDVKVRRRKDATQNTSKTKANHSPSFELVAELSSSKETNQESNGTGGSGSLVESKKKANSSPSFELGAALNSSKKTDQKSNAGGSDSGSLVEDDKEEKKAPSKRFNESKPKQATRLNTEQYFNVPPTSSSNSSLQSSTYIPPNSIDQERSLRQQQDLEYELSVQQDLQKQEEAMKESLLIDMKESKKKELQEKIELLNLLVTSDRDGATASTVNIAFKFKSKSTNTLQRLNHRFSSESTILQLLDYIQGQELNGEIFENFELSLSYPKIAWERKCYNLPDGSKFSGELILEDLFDSPCDTVTTQGDTDNVDIQTKTLSDVGISSNTTIWVHFPDLN